MKNAFVARLAYSNKEFNVKCKFLIVLQCNLLKRLFLICERSTNSLRQIMLFCYVCFFRKKD